MPAETAPLVLHAGQIVLADWRGDALPKEPNKRRPAVVVEDDGLFAPAYPNVILVPLTEDAALAIPDLFRADRADGREWLRQDVLGGVAPGGADIQGAAMGYALMHYAAAIGGDPPADRYCRGWLTRPDSEPAAKRRPFISKCDAKTCCLRPGNGSNLI